MGCVKIWILALIVTAGLSTVAAAEDLTGFWQTVDKQTRLPTSVIAVYTYQGKYYGKIVASYNKQGVMEETLDHPRSRATGVAGRPYYCGLDIICVTPGQGREHAKGCVVDPRSGKVYNSKLWIENNNLILRGELLMFGRNEVLLPFSTFSAMFPEPDLSTFVPNPGF